MDQIALFIRDKVNQKQQLRKQMEKNIDGAQRYVD